jgi:diguanylate cyclase (GGDEF)-like protein
VQCLELGADDFIRHGCSSEEIIARMRAVLRLKEMTDKLRTANHHLKILSRTDELTGLENMRSFTRRYAGMLGAVKSEGTRGLGVIMLDLDHFKSVNDSTNHLMGSFVLSEIGVLIRQSNIFPDGASARYGGDEFVFAWHCDSLDAIIAKAQDIRKMIESHKFERDGASVQLTASIGVAFVAKGFGGRSDDVIKAADLMLYRSKNSGRNQVNGMILKYPVELERGAADELAARPAAKKPASLTASFFLRTKP